MAVETVQVDDPYRGRDGRGVARDRRHWTSAGRDHLGVGVESRQPATCWRASVTPGLTRLTTHRRRLPTTHSPARPWS